jgi:MarR family transcriptional regulator, transcriptional regulator for hemolysin
MPAVAQIPAADSAAQRDDCPECLMGNLNWLLAQAHYALATELAAAFEPLGLTPRGHAVLAAALAGTHTQKQLADVVGLDKTTMVATLDELERAGFARRVPSASDRRAHVVEVTPEGRRKVTAANRVAKRVEADVLRSLGDETGEDFIATLGRLVTQRLGEPAACKGVRRREPR